MYAVVTTFVMDDDRFAEQQKELQAFIIPGVTQNPGFRAGYWTRDRTSGRSHNLLVFDTEAHARHLAQSVQDNSERQREVGIQLEALTVAEVVGEAHR